jgi:hypothetical protein
VATPTAGEPFRIKLVEGRCFFLDPENRCRIHTELSYDDKPAVCKSFPLNVLEVAGTRYARMSFWCPTVAANAGKPLEHQARWIRESSKHIDRRSSPLRINRRLPIEASDFGRLHQALRRFLTADQWPMADRLAAGAALIERLDQASGSDLVTREVAVAESEGVPVLASATRGHGRSSRGRRVLSLYLLQDAQGGRLAALGRFVSVVLWGFGVGALRCRAVASRAGWRRLKEVPFTLSSAGDELLTRYICSKLDSRRYIAGDATLVTGFNLLVAAYGVINVLARMRAASAGRQALNDEDVLAAVRASDLLVVEHPGLYGATHHTRLIDAALGTPRLCADLLARLGS